MLTANEIRQQFIDFFCKKHGHTFVPSSSVIPHGDDSLLFSNAGMNQFKPIFLGLEKRDYVRVANTQKCIRAGGKHNDLDDVGKDTYHHTFFEMLGNWSFGDYFKKEAIAWAWELLTEVWKLDPTRLHVTVFEGDLENKIPRDDEAAGFWKAVGVPEKHIHLGNKKDNFWEMGNTGPCGPCTEVHYDHTPDKSGGKLVNMGTDRVIEIWNLVFIQFNRNEDRSLTPLPAKHVDTGMGFERVVKVIQGKSSNYDTDVFLPIIDAIREVTKASPYTGKLDDRRDTAYRVIADHIRSLTFSLTDGGVPDNAGAGSTIRSILRRACLFGWLDFGMREAFVHKLVPAVVSQFGEAFPEMKTNPAKVIATILDEEKGFLRTIERGLKLYGEAESRARKSGGVISAKDAFDLHTEQGFFLDITSKLASDAGLSVDTDGYKKLFKIFKDKSREGGTEIVVSAIQGELPKTDDSPKYGPSSIAAKVVGWVKDNTVFREGKLEATAIVSLLLERTNFYSEQGGQIGDMGRIKADGMEFVVEGTQRLGDSVLHRGVLTDGKVTVGQTVTTSVTDRSSTVRNHTATHLLNLALREVLGEHVEQKGSLVDLDKTRFDFSHDKPITPDEIQRIEELVNDRILRDMPVTAINMPLAEAKKLPGVRAVFGEKYPDPVRVVMIGSEKPGQVTADMSVEFCGGTHLSRTSQAALFKVTGQENVAKGIRRITAVTGQRAFEYVQELAGVVSGLTGRLNCSLDELPKRVESLQEEVKKLQKLVQKGSAGDLNNVADQILTQAAEIKGVKLVVGEVPGGPVDAMRGQIDRLRQKAGSSLIVLAWKNDDGSAGLAVGVSEDLVKKGIKSNDVIKPIAELIGGKGGGPPHLATAGGKDASRLTEALAKAVELGSGLLSR
ncbi:MAG: alanine--tRNA ligase [Gemmataceae bacterium]|nr:alanine--tRNA ligase [Gemmataceae bacterium]